MYSVALRVELAEISSDEGCARGADDLRDHIVREAAHPKQARLLGAVQLGAAFEQLEYRSRGAGPQARLARVAECGPSHDGGGRGLDAAARAAEAAISR